MIYTPSMRSLSIFQSRIGENQSFSSSFCGHDNGSLNNFDGLTASLPDRSGVPRTAWRWNRRSQRPS